MNLAKSDFESWIERHKSRICLETYQKRNIDTLLCFNFIVSCFLLGGISDGQLAEALRHWLWGVWRRLWQASSFEKFSLKPSLRRSSWRAPIDERSSYSSYWTLIEHRSSDSWRNSKKAKNQPNEGGNNGSRKVIIHHQFGRWSAAFDRRDRHNAAAGFNLKLFQHPVSAISQTGLMVVSSPIVGSDERWFASGIDCVNGRTAH